MTRWIFASEHTHTSGPPQPTNMENNIVLPIEIWTQVFGHLNHTEKLISRLVCKKWNHQISKGLAKTYFSMKSVESHEVLLDSVVPWTKLRMGEYSSSGFPLPTDVRNLITSIQLKISGLKECMTIVIRFPNLTDLDLTINDDRNKTTCSNNSEGSEISLELKESFEKSLEKLKYLSITFPYCHDSALYNLLGGFLESKISLAGLKIQQEDYHYKHNSGAVVDQNNRKRTLAQIYSLISKSAQTLISLDLEINEGDHIQDFQGLFYSELITKLITLEDLQLQAVRIQAESSDESEDRDFDTLQNFLKSQTNNVKNIVLPWSYKDSLSVSQEFMFSLSKDLESVERLTKEHTTDEFLSKFTKLERISLVPSNPLMFNSNGQYPNVRIFQINFRTDFDTRCQEADVFYRNISNSFVDLAELHILIHGEYSFFGSELQLVIKYLNQLRVLEIDDCSFGDNGVTGINYDYIEELTLTGRIYRCLEVPKEHIEGIPLSSLKSLEKLVLLNLEITDSGIYHGLQFGTKLKHLTLGANRWGKVTEWGMYWLAAGNPSLEVFDVSLTNTTISKNGIEDVRRQLPLVKSTRKFKVVYNTE